VSVVTEALLFVYASVALILSINALRRPSPPGSRFPPLWLPAMITSELAPLWVAVRVSVLAAAVAAGALDRRLGRVGSFVLAVAAALQAVLVWRRMRAARSIESEIPSPAPGPAERVFGRPVRLPGAVEHLPRIAYDGHCTVDLWRPAESIHGGALLYLHGGGWTGGAPGQTEQVLVRTLVDRGWTVASVRYPLSPEATFPEHLISIKRAIAWAKSGGIGDVEADRVALAGGSAGAHLAALAALTPTDPAFQPGFEDADTSVAACVGMYGVYDFVNRRRNRPDWPVIPRAVMKASPVEEPARFRSASPVDRVGPDAPPFLLVHGTMDSLVPLTESELFLEALREGSRRTAELLAVPGAQHAFDAVSSPRSRAVAARVAGFLEDEVPAGGDITPSGGAS
jgi:acetyl esterase/lipase